MTVVRCRVGKANEALVVPLPLSVGGISIEEAFRLGSRLPGGGAAIDLRVEDESALESVRIDDPHVTTWHLHEALANLLDGPDSVGIVFADRYEGRNDVFGLMFDSGVGDMPTHTFHPREGCAVFVGAIAKTRGDQQLTLAAITDEVVFTAIHELGHVFNLWHLDESSDPPSFMRSSAKDRAVVDLVGRPGWTSFPEGEQFRLQQRSFLQRHPQSAHVAPRGSQYGVRGTDGPPGDDGLPANVSTYGESGIDLKVGITPSEFYAFEPFELDLVVSVPRGAGAISIPDELDPGYGRFRLWIEEPTGERRCYRSLVRYCRSAGSTLLVGPEAPFSRDIPIFAQADGYTFRMPGVHRVSVEFALAPGEAVVSNVVEIGIKPRRERSREYRALRVLEGARPAAFFFYRLGPTRGSFIETLNGIISYRPKHHVAGSAQYAMGRNLARIAARTTDPADRSALAPVAVDCLKWASEHSAIGPGRRRNAIRALKALAGG